MNSNRYAYFLNHFTGQLPIGESFDLVERRICIGERRGRLYFVDGLSDSEKLQILFNFLLAVPKARMTALRNTDDFMEELFPLYQKLCYRRYRHSSKVPVFRTCRHHPGRL